MVRIAPRRRRHSLSLVQRRVIGDEPSAWPTPSDVPHDIFNERLACLRREFDTTDAEERLTGPVDPLLIAANSLLLDSSVVGFFNRDIAYAGAHFLASLHCDVPLEYRAYLAEDALIRLSRGWDYLTQVLREHLQLSREVSRAIQWQLIGLNAKQIDFLPADNGGTWIQESWRPRREALRRTRTARRQTRVLELTKDVKRLNRAIRRQFRAIEWLEELLTLMKKEETRQARNTRDEIIHVAPLAAAARMGSGVFPGAAMNVGGSIDWGDMERQFVLAHRALADAIGLLRRVVRSGDIPPPSAASGVDTAVFEVCCVGCRRQSWFPVALAELGQRAFAVTLCCCCGDWLPRPQPHERGDLDIRDVSAHVFALSWNAYCGILPDALNRLVDDETLA